MQSRVNSEKSLKLIKICFIGNSGVGKTSMILRFFDNKFNHNLTTLGIDYRGKIIYL